jgi:hypothetical protein
MHGKLQEWNCRAGQNNVIIRVDGTLGPCFPMYSATHDWGTIENPNFADNHLKKMKKECQPRCFSTLNHNLAFCYNDGRAAQWILKQAMRGFQGLTGSFTSSYLIAGDESGNINPAQRFPTFKGK